MIPQRPRLDTATRHVDGWRTIALRAPASDTAPLVFTIDAGSGRAAAEARHAHAGSRHGRRYLAWRRRREPVREAPAA